MGPIYVWQKSDWPNFIWDSEQLLEDLGQARKLQGKILGFANFVGLEAQANLLAEEAMTTSAIEGEKLNKDSVRSSVARRLGLSTSGLPPQQREIDGLIEMLMDATSNHQSRLTAKRLFGWQAALFPTGFSGLRKIAVGTWRKGTQPMQVISGRLGKEKIHFEAPPSSQVAKEMKAFFDWWEGPSKKLDGIIRAGIAHFWFVTIHPFEDGNGRIARAITDMALAQDEQTGCRFYSLSSQIVFERNAYYDILEASQKKNSDLTLWLKWFLKMFCLAIEKSEGVVAKALNIARFWQLHNQAEFNSRQIKIINRLLEAEPEGFEGGMTNRKYVGLTKVSRETAKRDIAELEEKGVLKRNSGKGRSISYSLSF
ncbi:MAG TPA: Fic family protein [Pseudobdellovibrionaceae bacterium]